MERWTNPGQGERRSPLPGFLSLPARGWQALSRGGRAAVVTLAAALLVVAVLLVPPALDNAAQNEADERAAIAANRERIRRDLVQQQRPRRARLDRSTPVVAAVAEEVGADARARVRAGTLEGPVSETSCRPLRRSDGDPLHAGFTCLAERGRRGEAYRGRDIVLGYRFRARVKLATGVAVWCKESPPPLHADQEEFVKVPVSPACTG